MKQLLATALVAAVALLGLTPDSQAHGKFRSCSSGCNTVCASAPCAPAPVQYVDQKVTVWKQVIKDKQIEVLVCKPYTREEKYNYTVCVPVMKQEKRQIIECTYVNKQVEYTCTVMVPQTVDKLVKCTTYQCVREMVTENVPVCRTVCVTCVDECGRCRTHRERVTVMEQRTRCVVKRIPIVTEQMVKVCTYVPTLQKGVRTVCEVVRTPKDVMVNVCTYQQKPMVGTRMVCEYKTEKVMQTVKVCEMVATQQVVRVPVCATTSCSTPCDNCGNVGHHSRGGLFRRGSSCCN